MKKANFTRNARGFLCALLLGLSGLSVQAQTTTQIGMGTNTSSLTLYAPVYRYSATSATTACRSNIIYTAAELGAAGIAPGSTITALAFNKTNVANFVVPASFNMYMGNTGNVPPLATTTTWASIMASHTQVYQNASFNIPSGTGWITWNVTPFVYTGGSLEIAFELSMQGNGGATDEFNWEFTSGFSGSIIGVANATSATLNGTAAAYKERPNIRITYAGGAPCTGVPTAGTITASSNTVCPSEQLYLSASGGTTGSNLSYQWQSSTNGITWNDIAGATFPSYTTTQSTPNNYRLRVICNTGPDTAYSNTEFVDVAPFLNCYCTSTATSTNYTDIDHIQFSNLTTTPSPSCAMYTDYTATPIGLIQGVPYSFQALITNCSSATSYTSTTKVYIDYNHNGSYTDAGEEVFVQSTTSGNYVSGTITVPPSALTGQTGMRIVSNQTATSTSVNPCGTYTNGETEDYIVNISPQPADEVSLVSIDAPVRSQCSLGNEILVTLRNNGTDTLYSVVFDLNQSGAPNNNIPWTGVIAPGAEQQVQVPGVYVFNDGDTLGVAVRDPNGVADNTFDNARGLRHYLSLGGEYTVGYGVTDLLNHEFADLTAAIQFVYQKGVCDTVYLNIKDGTYTNRFLLQGDYFDYDPGELVVLRSETKNAANLIMQENGSAAGNNYLVRLDGTRGWGFQHITFQPLGTSFRNAIHMLGGSSDILIDSCRFIGSTNNTGLTTAADATTAITMPSGSSEKNITISNNFFQDFGGGVRMYGASGNYETGNKVINNQFTRIHATAIYSYYQSGGEIANNLIAMDTIPGGGAATQYGIYLYYQIGGSITGNTFIADTVNYAIYMGYTEGTALQPYLIANNFFYNGTTVSNASAIRSANASNSTIDIVNNSISFATNATTYALLDLSTGSNYRVLNNIVTGTGNALLIEAGTNITLLSCDYNNWYKPAGTGDMGNLVGQIMPTLSDWKTASTFDVHSVEVDPLFVGADLHTCVAELDGAGIAYAGISTDIDGDARMSTPDIGADEFLGSNLGLLTDDLLDKCAGDAVTIGAPAVNNVTYSWLPGGGTGSQISVTQAGTYVIEATSACGTFTDTVVVNDLPGAAAAFDLSGSYGLAALIENNSTGGISYLWNFGDGSTSTAEEPYHLYDDDGIYVITLTVYGACDTVTTTEVYTAVALSAEEWAAGSFELFPNPASDVLNIRYTQLPAGEVTAEIMDISGKTVFNTQLVSGQNGVQTLDVSTLKAGVYHLRIRTGQAQKVLKFVKK